MDEVRKAIEGTIEKFVDAFGREDAAAIAALYTEGARLLPPDGPMMTGREAIRMYWGGAMNIGVKDAKLEPLEVESRDDTAYELGRFSMSAPAPGGGMVPVNGKYVVVWKRVDDRWMMDVDIWNTDALPSAGGKS